MKKTISLGSRKAGALVLVLALGLIASVANAEFIFGTATNLGPTVNSTVHEYGPSISADGLSLYFASNRPGGHGGLDIWVTTRPTKDEPWAEPVNLGPTVNSSAGDWGGSIPANGLELFFEAPRSGGAGGHDLWVTTRATTDDDWGNPVNLGPTVNSSAYDCYPSISSDGMSLYFASKRPGGAGDYDLWVTTRPTVSQNWGPPVNLGPTVNSSYSDATPCISADGSILFFLSERPGGVGGHDIWVTTRATANEPWEEPVNLGPTVNTSAEDRRPSISADGLMLFFSSNRPGGYGNYDIWQAPIEPVVDFNGDGIVDAADMCIMVDYWGTDEPLCDIGPMPWGDGIVDVQDLMVLAEHLFEEIFPIGLVAYWKLDETEGDIAYDSAAVNDAVVFGDAVWQPDGGQVNGALAFDGTDDYVSTPFVLNPADGPFSVFAWIKGGAPGQVVISQISGANWLLADPSEGKLRTSLLRPVGGRTAPQPLISEFIITDGAWHRVGFVWDGSYRTLYVDGTEVAKDTEPQGYLVPSDGGLYFGAASTLDAASFFSGLIDDVRIYNRAVSP